MRQIREEDCRLLWEWANDPHVRAVAFSTEPIPWEDHVKWFAYKLNDPNCLIFLALDDRETPIGQIRFDITDAQEAEIDVSIARDRRISGYGTLLLKQGVEEIFRTTSIQIVHAFIKPNNVGSIRVFEKAGFEQVGLKTMKGQTAKHYLRVGSDE